MAELDQATSEFRSTIGGVLSEVAEAGTNGSPSGGLSSFLDFSGGGSGAPGGLLGRFDAISIKLAQVTHLPPMNCKIILILVGGLALRLAFVALLNSGSVSRYRQTRQVTALVPLVLIAGVGVALFGGALDFPGSGGIPYGGPPADKVYKLSISQDGSQDTLSLVEPRIPGAPCTREPRACPPPIRPENHAKRYKALAGTDRKTAGDS